MHVRPLPKHFISGQELRKAGSKQSENHRHPHTISISDREAAGITRNRGVLARCGIALGFHLPWTRAAERSDVLCSSRGKLRTHCESMVRETGALWYRRVDNQLRRQRRGRFIGPKRVP